MNHKKALLFLFLYFFVKTNSHENAKNLNTHNVDKSNEISYVNGESKNLSEHENILNVKNNEKNDFDEQCILLVDNYDSRN